MNKGMYNSETNSYSFNRDLDFNSKFFSSKEELEAEVIRSYRSSLGLKIQTNLFTGIDNYGNTDNIDSKSVLAFQVVETPLNVLLWWVTEYKVIPVWYIEPYGWDHPDYCSFMYETPTEYNLEGEAEDV